jgi:DNA-binding response OmpR family regulator
MAPAFSVVVIDDDPDLRQLIRLTLQFTAGWDVATAADGPSGIAAVGARHPDAVIVDLMMPGMDGYEVCRRLKAEAATARIPLVLLTARKELDEDRVREVGAAGVILKPFDLDQLAERVRTLCAGTRA